MATTSFPEQAPGNGRELEKALKVLNLRFEDVVFRMTAQNAEFVNVHAAEILFAHCVILQDSFAPTNVTTTFGRTLHRIAQVNKVTVDLLDCLFEIL